MQGGSVDGSPWRKLPIWLEDTRAAVFAKALEMDRTVTRLLGQFGFTLKWTI